jgi:putative hydrolase of the HAD superfamily
MSDPSHPAYLPLHKFTHRFASQLIGHRKPDQAIYAHVEQAAAVPGQQIAFFDDVPQNVQAARRRGWQAEQILHDGQPIHQIRRHLRRLGVLD